MSNTAAPGLRLLRAAAVACLLVIPQACTGADFGLGGAGSDAGSGAGGGGNGGGGGSGNDTDTGGGSSGSNTGLFDIPAATGSYSIGFGIGLSGRGTGRIGAISVASAAGTIEIDGDDLPVAVYERQAWPEQNYNLYQGLAVTRDRWYLIWFYCQGGQLTDLYYEGTNGGGMDLADASGTCQESDAASTVRADFPATDLSVPNQPGGFAVNGTDIAVDGSRPGWVRVGSATFTVYVFNRVDCTEECTAGVGWHELHALLWDPERQWLSFGIFYLFEDHQPVRLAYAFALPALQAPFGPTTLPATWTDP